MIELSVMGVRTEESDQRNARHRGDGDHRVTRQAARDPVHSILGSFLFIDYPTTGGSDTLSR
jgi:hypothetical protein